VRYEGAGLLSLLRNELREGSRSLHYYLLVPRDTPGKLEAIGLYGEKQNKREAEGIK